MRALRPSTSVPLGRLRSLATLAATGALLGSLLGGCTAAPGTPAASGPAISALPSATGAPDVSPTADATSAHWEGAGTTAWARHAPRATLLGDGRVLVLGDEGGKYEPVPEISRFAELWDPVTGVWSETGYLPTARGQFALVTLDDGRALVAGGMNQAFESYSSAYIFDPSSGSWTKTGLLGTARAEPAAAVLRDGRVLVVGGRYCTGKDLTGSAETVAPAVYRGAPATDVALADARLADADPGPTCYALATAELFDPRTGTWSETGPMRFARDAPSAITLADGRVLVVGGWAYAVGHDAAGETEIYDPATGRFGPAGSLPAVDPSSLEQLGVASTDGSDRAYPGGGELAVLDDGGAVLLGTSSGWSSPEGYSSVTRSFRFDPASGRWTEIGTPFVRVWSEDDTGGVWTEFGVEHPGGITVRLGDGRVLVAGGTGEDQLGIRDAEVYDPVSDTWSTAPQMPGARVSAVGVALADGSALIVDGYSNGSDGYPIGLADCFRFVPGG